MRLCGCAAVRPWAPKALGFGGLRASRLRGLGLWAYLAGRRAASKFVPSSPPDSGEENGEGWLPLLHRRLSLPWPPCTPSPPWPLGDLETHFIHAGRRERRKNACSLSPLSGGEKGEGLLPLLRRRLSLPWPPSCPGSLDAWKLGGLKAWMILTSEAQRIRLLPELRLPLYP